MLSRFILPRLAGIARYEPFTWQKAIPPSRVRLASRQGAPGRRATILISKRFNAFSKERYEKLALQGSSVSRVAQLTRLAGAPSLHVNRPLFIISWLDAKESCFNICLNIKLHKPVINLMKLKYKRGLMPKTVNHFTLMLIKCKSGYSTNRQKYCDRNTF